MFACINSIKPIKINGKHKILCPVKIGNHTTVALIDSGNLVREAISESLAKLVFGSNFKSKLVPVTIKIGTANKGKRGLLDVIGHLERPIRIRLGSFEKLFWFCPMVVRNLNHQVNLGSSFLSSNQIDHLYSTGQLEHQGKQTPLFNHSQFSRLQK